MDGKYADEGVLALPSGYKYKGKNTLNTEYTAAAVRYSLFPYCYVMSCAVLCRLLIILHHQLFLNYTQL